MKGGGSGLNFSIIQELGRRDWEKSGKNSVPTSIRNWNLLNTSLEALPRRANLLGETRLLKTRNLLSQLMEAELKNRLGKPRPKILREAFEIWIRPVPLLLARNVTILFINKSGQNWNEYFDTLTSERSRLSDSILMFLVSEICVLHVNWLLLLTTCGKRKQI